MYPLPSSSSMPQGHVLSSDLPHQYNAIFGGSSNTNSSLNATFASSELQQLQDRGASTMFWSAMPFLSHFMAHIQPFNPNFSMLPGPSMGITYPPNNGSGIPLEANEDVIIQALIQANLNNQNYKRALEGIHGVNNVPEEFWRDYYLRHKFRIDETISARLPQILVNQTKNMTKSETSAIQTSEPQRSKSIISISSEGSSIAEETTIRSAHIKGSRKLTESDVDDDDRTNTPSRSPTSQTQCTGSRQFYTKDDKKYLAKFVRWQLRKDPRMSKDEICININKRMPHHSVKSWEGFWQRYDGPHKRTYAAARARLRKAAKETGLRVIGRPPGPSKRRRLHFSPEPFSSEDASTTSDSDSDEEDSYTCSNGDTSGSDGASDSSSDMAAQAKRRRSARKFLNIDVNIPKATDEANLGFGQNALNEADIRLFARHVAANPKLSQVAVSRSFHELYPHRPNFNYWRRIFWRWKEDLAFLLEQYEAIGNDSGERQGSHSTHAPLSSVAFPTTPSEDDDAVIIISHPPSPVTILDDDDS